MRAKKEKERKEQTSKRLFHISIQGLTAAVYTSVVNFINILRSIFFCQYFGAKKFQTQNMAL